MAEPMVASIGIICGILSAAIYAAAEAYVDAAALNANTTSKVITATSNSNSVVQTALNPEVNVSTDNTKV